MKPQVEFSINIPDKLRYLIHFKTSMHLLSTSSIDAKKIRGVPAKWTSLITNWQPMNEFADVQLKGPYSKWYHRHLFRPLSGGVLLEDKVVYRLPFSRFGGNFLHGFIRKDIKTIFSYRRKRIKEWCQLRQKLTAGKTPNSSKDSSLEDGINFHEQVLESLNKSQWRSLTPVPVGYKFFIAFKTYASISLIHLRP